MPDLYEKHLPPPEVAVQLPPEELALFVLRFLSDPDAGSTRNRYNFTLMSATQYPGNVERTAVATALAEAWAWLEREGLIVPRPGQTGEWFEVSRRGKQLTAQVDFEAYKRGNLLRRDSLDPTLEQKVWPLFIRGDYDVAVFQAFKLVEVRVRKLGKYSDSDLGVDMMQRAFKPDGSLADPGQQPAEREALRSLFAGAIGLFKNPGSHRSVTFEPAEAAEAVYLSNTLLRFLGRAETRLKGQP
ncbi:MAG: TIGR02391 family protein [Candidatus Rokubacteria bacterium]|nr:TIGR02391 family protein [Candidatus Rokubacteria bacterium]